MSGGLIFTTKSKSNMESALNYLTNLFGEVTITTDGCWEVDAPNITFDEVSAIYDNLFNLGLRPYIEISPAIHNRLITIIINF
jgi:hypothetical protein